MIDRLSPADRPPGRPAGFQRWRQLLFLHWEIDPDAARATLHPALELDTFDGKAYVGVVAFTMRDVSPWWSPSVPGVSNFHELNVRTYVVRNGVPGVWFYSLDAANAIAVAIARTGWRLPYHRATMRLDTRDGVTTYSSERRWPKPKPATFRARYRLTGDAEAPRRAEAGTLDHFLVERYVLFAPDDETSVRLGRVHHEPYPLIDVEVDDVGQDVVESAGLSRLSDDALAHYSAGVDVDIFALARDL